LAPRLLGTEEQTNESQKTLSQTEMISKKRSLTKTLIILII